MTDNKYVYADWEVPLDEYSILLPFNQKEIHVQLAPFEEGKVRPEASLILKQGRKYKSDPVSDNHYTLSINVHSKTCGSSTIDVAYISKERLKSLKDSIEYMLLEAEDAKQI